jgi:DNA-binding NarL/FixJ family response regulator
MVINVLIAEDHELSRQGISYGLKKYKNLNVIGESENGKEAVKFCEKNLPDVVLMDIVMPIMSGIDAAKKIKEMNPEIKILMLTSHSEKDKVLSAFNAGADAYCMKNIKLDDLENVIVNVINGAVWIDPTIAGYVLEILQSKPEAAALPQEEKERNYTDFNLTNREKEILKLISEGLTNKDMADKLFISLYTVKNHVSKIIQKLAVDDRTQAAILALNERII